MAARTDTRPSAGIFSSREEFETFVARVLRIALLLFFLVITAFPFYWMINMAARPYQDVALHPTRIIPTTEQIKNVPRTFEDVWIEFGFRTYVVNSIKLSTGTVLLTLLLSIPGAYATTRLEFRLKNVMSSGSCWCICSRRL